MKKPGYKTTEFWLSTAALIVGVAFASGIIADGSTVAKVAGLIAGVLGSLGYTVSRGMVKKGESEAEAEKAIAEVIRSDG